MFELNRTYEEDGDGDAVSRLLALGFVSTRDTKIRSVLGIFLPPWWSVAILSSWGCELTYETIPISVGDL